MSDKGPYGKSSWSYKHKVASNPELDRSGKGTSGNRELLRGSGMPPANSELCRSGTMPATMPELDRGGFRGMPFVDNTARNEAMTEDQYDADDDLIPGHKQMAGMP
jgi:hypothetical protein